MSASHTQSATMLPAQEAYALWASTYDQTPNPLLLLEERFLAPVLSTFAHRDIVDLGCGTGRWLQHLEASAPRSLTGVDSSPAMLAEARKKCRKSTALIQASSAAIPLPDRVSRLRVGFVSPFLHTACPRFRGRDRAYPPTWRDVCSSPICTLTRLLTAGGELSDRLAISSRSLPFRTPFSISSLGCTRPDSASSKSMNHASAKKKPRSFARTACSNVFVRYSPCLSFIARDFRAGRTDLADCQASPVSAANETQTKILPSRTHVSPVRHTTRNIALSSCAEVRSKASP